MSHHKTLVTLARLPPNAVYRCYKHLTRHSAGGGTANACRPRRRPTRPARPCSAWPGLVSMESSSSEAGAGAGARARRGADAVQRRGAATSRSDPDLRLSWSHTGAHPRPRDELARRRRAINMGLLREADAQCAGAPMGDLHADKGSPVVKERLSHGLTVKFRAIWTTSSNDIELAAPGQRRRRDRRRPRVEGADGETRGDRQAQGGPGDRRYKRASPRTRACCARPAATG